jgi:hypothetical protein
MSTAEGHVPRILLWPWQVAVCARVGEDAMKTTCEIGFFAEHCWGLS